ncbi:MAG TPA: hypothetical protein VFQ67_14675 [Allosphingosinicella sp.]|jgi:hypothetical protein|nr:hypothetical protein [Allosphingosinicella sp.]
MKRVAALLPLLAACGGPPAAKVEERIECAVDGAAAFRRVCVVERTAGRDVLLTIRSPSGSFRRLVATRDGRGVMAADGAEPATVAIVGKGLIEVSIGTDRYRLPARVR